MAFVLSDRIKETTTTTGTGTYTLGGAVSGFETFTANLSNSDTTYYCCTDGSDFEVGLGTFASSGTTLARTTIISSSNSNNAVSWSSGTREIFCTLPGSKAVFKDGSDNINGTFVGDITGNVTGNASGTAATVTGAAQSNITSVGTLTGLTTSGTIDLSQTSGTAIKTTGNLNTADLTLLRASANTDGQFGFDIKYMGSRTGNNNSYSLFMHNQTGTDVEAMTVLQDGKVGINNTSPSAPLDVVGNVELVGDVTGLTSLTVDNVIVNGTTIGHTDDTDLITLADGVATVAGKLDAGIIEGKGGVTYDPPGSSGTDTATDVAVAVHSGDRIVLGENGYIRTIADATWGSALQFGQSGTGAFAGTEIYGGNSGVKLHHSSTNILETKSTGVDVTGDLTAITSDGAILSLQTSDTTVADGDTIGLIEFKAPSEASGTDAILTAAAIVAEADATFAADNNQTDMVFKLGSSEAATEKMRLSHEGVLTLSSTDAGASAAPTLSLYRNSASPASSDDIGQIQFFAENDADEKVEYARIDVRNSGVTDGAEYGQMDFMVLHNGSEMVAFRLSFNLVQFYRDLYIGAPYKIQFEGSNYNDFETDLTVDGPTADRTITLPDATGTVTLNSATQTLTNKTLTSPKINEDVAVTSTATEINKLDGVTATTTELNYVDVTTLGTVEASKAVTADSGADITFPSGSQIITTSDGSNAVMSVRGSGPNFIEFLDGTGTADGVQIAYRTTPHDLRIERRHNGNIIAEFGGDDGHAALYHANSIKLETTSGGVDVTGDLTLTSTDAGSGDNPTLTLKRDSSSPADFDNIGNVDFVAENDASEAITVASISGMIDDVTDGTEDGRIRFSHHVNGTHTDFIDFTSNQLLFLNEGKVTWYQQNGSYNISLLGGTPSATRTVTMPDATGTIITTGNSDTPTTTTSSSDADFVLVDDGGTMKKITPANLGVGGGLLVSLANDTSGATTSALEIDLSTSTDYAYQMLVLRGFDSSTAANLLMQLRKDSDDSYLTDSYLSVIGSHIQTSSSNSSGQNGLWNGAHFQMNNNNFTTDGAHQLNDMKIYFFNTATDKKAVVGADRFGQNSSGVIKEQMAGKSGHADVNDRFKLFLSSGNLVYDEYTLYGFKKA